MQDDSEPVLLCNSAALQDGGLAVAFDVNYLGQTCRAFAIRFDGVAYAYLNRCSHVPMEMDYQADRFFDSTGNWLICATHGATYAPATGRCMAGPCRGGLIKVLVAERDGIVRWHTGPNLKPIEF